MPYVQMFTGPDVTLMQNLRYATKRVVVVYGAATRLLAWVGTSFRRAKKVCDQVGATANPICYLLVGTLVYMMQDKDGRPAV